MSVPTYTKTGSKAATAVSLDKTIFGVEIKNHELLKDAYLAYLANARPNLATTKKRGEVRGGGRKPWRQKGTGRARFGSSRNPIWRGGGVAFGPSGNENYTRKLSITARRQALKQALSLSNTEGRLLVIEDFVLDGKTKSAANLLVKLGINGNCLLVTGKIDDKSSMATRNLENLRFVSASSLSAFDVMNADSVLIAKPALQALQERLIGKIDG